MNNWLCEQTRGLFYSNSYQEGEDSQNEFTINLKCQVVFMEYKEDEEKFDKAVVHYYMDSEISGNVESSKFKDEELKDKLYINRTVLNEQYFQVEYNIELEFLDVDKTEMYVYTQDIQNMFNGVGVLLPEIKDKESFDYFRSENNTIMLQESHPIIIAESKIQETVLETTPETITQNSVPNKLKDQVLGINVHFIKYLEDR